MATDSSALKTDTMQDGKSRRGLSNTVVYHCTHIMQDKTSSVKKIFGI